MEMGQYNHNQAAVGYPYPAGSTAQQGQQPYVAPPPPVGYPTKEGQVPQNNAVPVETKSRGDDDGWCAAQCCCCSVEACF